MDASSKKRVEITIPFHEREPKIRYIKSFGRTDGDYLASTAIKRWSRYLSNTWIPSQPDSDDLHRLMIQCKWNLTEFLRVIQAVGFEDEDEEEVGVQQMSIASLDNLSGDGEEKPSRDRTGHRDSTEK